MDDFPSAPMNTLLGKTGPGAPPSRQLPFAGGIAAFKDPPPAPFMQQQGPRPAKGNPVVLRFIPPLALYNDASQFVNLRFYARPFPFMQAPDSNPPLRAQYFTPPPINIANLAAGNLNLQLQLGQMTNQAAQLTQQASNFFGG